MSVSKETKAELVTKSAMNVNNDIANAGFEMKLTKDDLFELAIEQLIENKQALLIPAKELVTKLYTERDALNQKVNNDAKEQFLQLPLVVEFIKVYPKSKTTVSASCNEDEHGKATVQGKIQSTPGWSTDSSLQLKTKLTDDSMYKSARELSQKLNEAQENVHAIEREIAQIEKSPRKAKVAMLKAILAGSESGQNILEVVKNVQIDTGKLLAAGATKKKSA